MTFKGTSIVMGEGLIQTHLVDESCETENIVIITDSHLKDLYGKQLKSHLEQASKEVHLLTFKAGEASKTRAEKERLEDEMQKLGLGRDTTLIALGGGVTTDLAGFIAATYCRGIPFVSIPTTLLGMVDASLGGKTGVNTPYGKNLIGAFYLPHALLIDFNLLKSLKPEHMEEGLVEAIKKAMTCDEALFEEIEEHREVILKPTLEQQQVIKKAAEIKLKIVEEDFEEKSGKRAILNFGHTVGHALEKYFNYTLSHGKAVALGLIAESFMAKELDLLKPTHFSRIVDLLKPFIQHKDFDSNQVYDLMLLDKKSKNRVPHFVMIDRLGHAVSFKNNYSAPCDKEIVLSALKFIQEL